MVRKLTQVCFLQSVLVQVRKVRKKTLISGSLNELQPKTLIF